MDEVFVSGGHPMDLLDGFLKHVGIGGERFKGLLLYHGGGPRGFIVSSYIKEKLHHEPRATLNPSRQVWTFPSGETLHFTRGPTTATDCWKFHGCRYSWIGWIDIEDWPDDEAYLSLRPVLRGEPPLTYCCGGDPWRKDSPGGAWVRSRFGLSTHPPLGQIQVKVSFPSG